MHKGHTLVALDDDRFHVQHGPIDLIITIDAASAVRWAALREVNSMFTNLLADLVAELEALRQPAPPMPSVTGPVATAMADAVSAMGESTFLTPMASVAGAVADAVCAKIRRPGVDRVIVNNGGDIAFWLAPGRDVRVALANATTGRPLGQAVVQAEDDTRGVATSGRGGRSLTMGIADSVTVLASSAAIADAAATVIANAVDLPRSSKVTRVPATDIDSNSDLGKRPAVIDVASLTPTEQAQALEAGLRTANHLANQGLISAAALFIQDTRATTGQDPNVSHFRLLEGADRP